MKKIFIILGVVLFLTGCGKYNDKNLINDMSKKINNSKSYHLIGNLDIYRNEEKFSYDVDSIYKKEDLFKVDLKNKSNDHEQIIIKNNEGVFVITPSLNKSFKFQSDWPYNNSQIYLLQPIITDLSNEKDRQFKITNSGYVITSEVDYPTEKKYVKQKVYIGKDKNIKKVEILDKNNNVKMRLKISNIEYNTNINNRSFEEKTYQREVKKNDDKTSKIEDIVYPMYVPKNTYLTGQDVVQTSNGERAILTFKGDNNFTVIQETLSNLNSNDYVYGDPYLILDTVGAITDYSVSWISNGKEYSVISDKMNKNELISVAESLSVEAIGK